MTSFFGKLFINFGLGLTLRTDGEVLERSRALARRIAWPAAVAVVGSLVSTYVNANRPGYKGLVPPLVPVAAMGAVIAVGWLLNERLEGWAFVATAVTIVLVTATIFLNLYPRVMVSSLGPANGLTIDNAASGHYTLRGGDLHAPRACVPGLDVLGVPQARHLGPPMRRNSAPRSGVVPVTNRIRGKPGPPPSGYPRVRIKAVH
ncbi:MAG: cytochrome bd ubiquinol oxidase subunit [Actinomycetota bacterium]|jgi:hypothetical protein|nr:cytochrome bd ubiquinol oxidase subunit [Actinomycetota bacterium]